MKNNIKETKQPLLLSSCCESGFLKYQTEDIYQDENKDSKIKRTIVQRCDACNNACDLKWVDPKVAK